MNSYEVSGKRWVCEDFSMTVEAKSHAEALKIGRETAREIDINSDETVSDFFVQCDTTTAIKLSGARAAKNYPNRPESSTQE